MAKTIIQNCKIPILYTGSADNPDCSLPADMVKIDDTLTLFANGDVVIHDRYYYGNSWWGLIKSDEIDYAFPGGHAWRKHGSNTLVIRTRSPAVRQLVYEYGSAGIFHASWCQVIPRYK